MRIEDVKVGHSVVARSCTGEYSHWNQVADERRTVADLRKAVADLTVLTTSLESQVVALRAELQKVGKQTQNGSRFALLELD